MDLISNISYFITFPLLLKEGWPRKAGTGWLIGFSDRFSFFIDNFTYLTY